MGTGDTTLGGAARGFPDTSWGMISQIRQPGASRPGLERLCARYWKPVYRYVRIAWAKSNEDAKDLTQAFLAWLIEGHALARYEPSRGGFRAYLKVLLARFVGHQEEARLAMKRGGGAVVELDALASDEAVADARDPDAAFDRAWVKAVLDGAVERVRGRVRPDMFRVFEAADLAGESKPTYGELAERFGVKESDVRNWLYAVREELRREIRAELAQLTGDDAELEAEWLALFGARPS